MQNNNMNIQETSWLRPEAIPASFRDPDGYIFKQNNLYYRYIAPCYGKAYEQFMNSGCYAELIDRKLLIAHQDESSKYNLAPEEKILLPEQIPYITYPYEWSFGQLKEAALTTLEVLRLSLKHNMILKDASAYNVTWYKGRAVFLDTLSFDFYNEGQAWTGYRQFCSHFLAPLTLMTYTDLNCNTLLLSHLDGIPLELASKMLPFKTKLKPSLFLHLHAHASLQKRSANTDKKVVVNIQKKTIYNLIDSLKNSITSLTLPKNKTEWGEYYNATNYSPEQAKEKHNIIDKWLAKINPKTFVDIGSNDGTYSRLASNYADLVLAMDIDPIAVHNNYLKCKTEHDERMLPMLINITAPSPGIGWACTERPSLFNRINCECGMALALIHHLAISNNIPFKKIFAMLKTISPIWIIEFIHKEDSQVQKLLRNRQDIFATYDQSNFETDAKEFFSITDCQEIKGTKRILYLLTS